MLKTALTLGLLSVSSLASATYINTQDCAGEAHWSGEQSSQLVYRGQINTGNIYTHSNRHANILVTNTSGSPVTFFYTLSFYSESNSGLPANGGAEQFYGQFSNNNNPESAQGATMAANSSGRINIGFTSQHHYGYADLMWETSECLAEAPMLTSVENLYYVTSAARASISMTYLNNGRKW